MPRRQNLASGLLFYGRIGRKKLTAQRPGRQHYCTKAFDQCRSSVVTMGFSKKIRYCFHGFIYLFFKQIFLINYHCCLFVLFSDHSQIDNSGKDSIEHRRRLWTRHTGYGKYKQYQARGKICLATGRRRLNKNQYCSLTKSF